MLHGAGELMLFYHTAEIAPDLQPKSAETFR